MLVSGIQALRIAAEEGYALPAINYINMEHLTAIIAAAEELEAPIIIQTSQNAIDYAGFEYLRDLGVGRRSGPGSRWSSTWTTARTFP